MQNQSYCRHPYYFKPIKDRTKILKADDIKWLMQWFFQTSHLMVNYKSNTSSKMQAINIFGFKFTRSRVEEPVHSILKDDLACEIQSDSDAESRKRNSSEAALETSERKPEKKIYIKCSYGKQFLNE